MEREKSQPLESGPPTPSNQDYPGSYDYYNTGKYQQGRWQEEEHKLFLEALKLYGKDWGKVQQHVGTRSSTQARSHAQKFFQKIAKAMKNPNMDPLEFIKDKKNEKFLNEFEDSADERSENSSKKRVLRSHDGRNQVMYQEEPEPSKEENGSRNKRFAYGNGNEWNPEDRQQAASEEYVQQRRQPARESKIINVGYSKEIKKEGYLSQQLDQHSRIYHIMDYDQHLSTILEHELNTMSVCIMNYKGPSCMEKEEDLLKLKDFDSSKESEAKARQDRNNEYLVRSRRLAANLFNIDMGKLRKKPYTSRANDGYLIELKKFPKNSQYSLENTQKSENNLYLLNFGEGQKISSKQVPVTKTLNQDYRVMGNNTGPRLMKSTSYPVYREAEPEQDFDFYDSNIMQGEPLWGIDNMRQGEAMNRTQSLTTPNYNGKESNALNLDPPNFQNLSNDYGRDNNNFNFSLPNINNIEGLTKDKEF